MKKSEFFLQKPLDFPRENSIIGLTLGDEGRRPREAAGQLEGIGDVLSDGPRKFLGSLFTENGTDYKLSMKSLILAQNERWWRVLYMQVERRSNT